MADNTITIEHVIKGSDSNHGNVDISSILQQQNSLLQTLNAVLGKMEQSFSNKSSNGNSSGFNNTRSIEAEKEKTKQAKIQQKGMSDRQESKVEEINAKIKLEKLKAKTAQQNIDLQYDKLDFQRENLEFRKKQAKKREQQEEQNRINKFGKFAIGAGIGIGVDYIAREMNISAQYTMAKAQNTGSFAQSTVMGRGMQDYPSYLASQVQAKKQEQIAQHTSNWGVGGQSLRYGIDALVGGGTFLLTKNRTDALLAANFADNYASSLGDKFTNYFAASGNAKLSKEGDLQSAETQRDAMLRTGMWTSPLARFNNRKGADTQGFMDRYGKDQNVLGIQNGIAPYMNNAFNEHDLSGVAQNFLKAGYSVDQFAKLTLQATQYQVISGKDIKQFSEDMKQARAKYGAGYDLGTNQNAIDLMTKGVKPEEAQKIAYQSQFNPSVLQNVNSFLGNDRTSFETKKALGGMLGFDWLETERTGNLVGSPEFKKKITSELGKYNKSGGKEFGYDMTVLGQFGITPSTLGQWTTGSPEGYKGEISKDAMDASKNEAQQAGNDIIQAIQQGLSNITTVSTTGNITVVGKIDGTPPTKGSGGSPSYSPPFPF
jgi:hypothetical protein